MICHLISREFAKISTNIGTFVVKQDHNGDAILQKIVALNLRRASLKGRRLWRKQVAKILANVAKVQLITPYWLIQKT